MKLTLALPAHLAELLSCAADVDATVPVARGARPVLGLARRFGAGEFDSALLLTNSFGSALAVRLAGIPRRAGYARDARGWMLTEAVPCPPARRELHQAEYYFALVAELGASGRLDRSVPVRLGASPAAREQVAAVLAAERKRPGAPLHVLAPCAVGPGKEWPAEKFGRLAALLFSSGAEVVLVGAPGERDKTAAVAAAARAAGGDVIDLAGRNSVAQMAALFEVASGFAGNDSGPMHLAGAMGVPALGIFVSTDPGLYTPLGPLVSVIGGLGASPEPEQAAEALEQISGRRRQETTGGR